MNAASTTAITTTSGCSAGGRAMIAVLARPAVRDAQLALAGARAVDLAQLVVVSTFLFTRGGTAHVAAYGIVRTIVPALGVPVVTALGFRLGHGALLRIARGGRCRRVCGDGGGRRPRRLDARCVGVRRGRRRRVELLPSRRQRADAGVGSLTERTVGSQRGHRIPRRRQLLRRSRARQPCGRCSWVSRCCSSGRVSGCSPSVRSHDGCLP